ncbi:MAG: hypothetical protein FWH06_08620 [Oscillospiraceae bacterium]|nr:hypothetical protein [Oscillospiraceae bacterium]
MQQFNSYVMGVVCAAAAASVVMALTPKGWYRALIGVISGLTLTLVICRPLTSLRFGDFDGLLEAAGGGAEFEKYLDEQDKLLKEIIAEKTSAYILAKAQAMGVQCRVEVTIGNDPPRPEHIMLTGGVRPEDGVLERLSELIYKDCGIPPECQRFIWEE